MLILELKSTENTIRAICRNNNDEDMVLSAPCKSYDERLIIIFEH